MTEIYSRKFFFYLPTYLENSGRFDKYDNLSLKTNNSNQQVIEPKKDNSISDIFGIGLLLIFVGIFFLLMCCCCILGLQNISLLQQLPCFQSLPGTSRGPQNNNLNINGHLGCPNYRTRHSGSFNRNFLPSKAM